MLKLERKCDEFNSPWYVSLCAYVVARHWYKNEITRENWMGNFMFYECTDKNDQQTLVKGENLVHWMMRVCGWSVCTDDLNKHFARK
jgi:hypothetical protein